MRPPAPLLPAPPARPRALALGLWMVALALLALGAPRVAWLPGAPQDLRPAEPRLRVVLPPDAPWSLPPAPREPAPPSPPALPGPRGGGDERGTGTRDPQLATLPAPLLPSLPPDPWGEAALPLQPAAPALPPAPGGTGQTPGEGRGRGSGRGDGLGPGRGDGRPLERLPVKVDLRDLGLRGSAVPVHTVLSGETFEDTKVIIRLTFGADGTPYRWEPTYGDARLIPDALRAARKHYFTVPPRLQAQAPLQVDLVFRFRELGTLGALKAASPGGEAPLLLEASTLDLLQSAEPRYRPRVGEAFADPRVVLRVLLRENGVPFEAEVVSGDPRLRSSAREAALAHRFRVPPELRRRAPLAVVLTFTYRDLPE